MCNCDHDSQNDSGFVFGLILGAIIGAAIAIYIYKNNKSEIVESLKKKLKGVFKEPVKKVSKIAVTIPKTVKTINLNPVKSKKPVKLFKK